MPNERDALQLVAHMKIEAVALEVGYRSRKDFYRVLRQTMHMTPQVLRSLPRPNA
jgi:transcriptional regulator GlxA family with amidase domain